MMRDDTALVRNVTQSSSTFVRTATRPHLNVLNQKNVTANRWFLLATSSVPDPPLIYAFF